MKSLLVIIPALAVAFYATEVRAGWNSCMLGGDMHCPPNWKPYKNYCFRFYKDQKTWQDANEACQGVLRTEFSETYGYTDYQGSLAAIRSTSMNDIIYKAFFKQGFDGQRDLEGVKKLYIFKVKIY